MILRGAHQAARRFLNGEFKVRALDPPYESVTILRPDGEHERREIRKTHPTSFIGVMNL